jgi:Family of unknown function (DUF6788)
MKKHIEFDWPILPGSISTARSQCGKEGCACKKRRSPRLHGTYYRWTGFIDGKRTTKTISKEAAQECERRIKNFRKLQKEIDTLLAQALVNAPWIAEG